MRVLLVSSRLGTDVSSQATIEQLLKGASIEIVQCDSLKNAKVLGISHTTDLMIIHQRFLRETDAAKIIASVSEDLPILLVINDIKAVDIMQVYELGCIDYILEPLCREDFLNRVLLSRKRKYKIAIKDSMEYSLAHLRMSFSALFQNTPDAIVHFNIKHEIVDVNPGFLQLYGYAKSEVIGKYINNIIDPNAMLKEYGSYKVLAGESVYYEDTVRYHKNGNPIEVIHRGIPLIINNQVVGGYAIYTDITKRKQAEKKNRYLAYHDPLTGLLNMRSLQKQFTKTLSNLNATQAGAVLFIDIDRFKNVNDSLGHHFGDLLLQEIADRLKSILSDKPIYRPGGDEFIVILDDATGVSDISQQIVEEIAKPFIIVDRELTITTSIGISRYPQDGTDINTLFSNADTAMYRAKDRGKNQYCYYSEDMNARMLEELTLEHELRKAMENNEFELYYQPQYDFVTECIIGNEALIRWHNPFRGTVAPDVFIPIAEETGLILQIGEWVIREACHQNKQWQNQGLAPRPVAVNVSPLQFLQNDFVPKIEKILRETGLEPKYLDLEITESIAMTDINEAVKKVKRLRDLGIQVSIDDFGTGYSSLSNFRDLPINKLKIDRSFISRIHEDSKDAEIVDTIIVMAQKLGLEIIAEGVETKEHMQYLKERNCKIAQGYLFSKPVKALDIEQMLKNNHLLIKGYCTK
ncbi:putative bifunctional diguanylate cyclase/phosphodiesterase [Desulfuribacillus alkaliarsenatis]|uniref:Diguanylate cyclase n=1 Tax=Desulfuribacillus alkaliarsenatis TaxID=766136 RepID=A0A1E5G3K7_9FIRM|nr:EAL domain-containing protein [Desulfuribacillus alkaliarsenatis]OEF97669.1 hypothetical protein BHF68_14295 [Desulfuribacillus alkaliarsenatis]